LPAEIKELISRAIKKMPEMAKLRILVILLEHADAKPQVKFTDSTVEKYLILVEPSGRPLIHKKNGPNPE